jgi:hypothetical protein|nr:MAG TPA: hypothetical protein [Caudoviricetes sp.]
MITTEEIAIRVRSMLLGSDVNTMISGCICYQREDYSKEDVIIVPHTIQGERSVRFGQIKINIHVPDLPKGKGKTFVYEINFPRLIAIRAKVIEVLQNHCEIGEGWNWTIGDLQPPIKEQNHQEHFVSLSLELTIRRQRSLTN